MLSITDLAAGYKQAEVLHGLDLRVDDNEIVAVLGANGAGKTTLLKSIVGLVDPRRGRIEFDGRDITHLGPERTAALGISLVPEGRGVLRTLTVHENMMLGTRLRRDKSTLERDRQDLLELFPDLARFQHSPASKLSGGQQQMLVMARAMLTQAKLLICDEPSLGLAPIVVSEVMRMLQRLRESGVTVLLVEQNSSALRVADRSYVLRNGRMQIVDDASGTRKDALASVLSAYLGDESAPASVAIADELDRQQDGSDARRASL